jgi:hypothetical protein
MQTFQFQELTEIAANQLHHGCLLAFPIGDQQYTVAAVNQVSKSFSHITVHYDLPLGSAWKPTTHAQTAIERIDLTTGVPYVLVRQHFACDEMVLVLDNGWEKLPSPPTLFVIGAQSPDKEQRLAIQQEAHTPFGQIIILDLPKIYGQIKQEVQSQVALAEQTYLFIDWFGLHNQAVAVDEKQLPPWLSSEQQREAYKLSRAIQFPEVCMYVALFLAEKTRKIPVVIGAMRDSDGHSYLKACFPDPV